MRGVWIDVEGCRLYAAAGGSGEVLLVVHGGLASHEAVLPILTPLVDRYRVIAPDLRGSGRSHCSGGLTFDRFADDMARILDHLGIDRAFIGGISSGSGVAVRFALRYPERMRGLIVLKPIYGGGEIGYTQGQTQAFAAMHEVAGQAEEGGVEVLRPLYARLPEGIRERAWRVVETFDGPSVAATSRFIESGAQPFESSEELRSVEAPALLIRGDDEQHPAEISDIYERCLPNCVVLPATQDLGTAIADFCHGVINGSGESGAFR